MFDLIFFLIIILIIVVIIIENIRLKNKNTELIFLLTQSMLDLNVIKDKFNNLNQDTEKEHFLTFLNETREIAYTYIEDVHKALLEYRSEIEQDLNNPNDLSIHKFRSAFNKLKTIYPEDVSND